MTSKKTSEVQAQPFERMTRTDKHHVRLFYSMIFSPAYKSLSSEATRLYTILKTNYWGSSTTAKCPYSYITENTDIHRNRIRKRLEELEAFGFIEITEDTAKSKRGRPANLYKFSEKWKDVSDVDALAIKKRLGAKEKEDSQRKGRGKEKLKEFLKNNEP